MSDKLFAFRWGVSVAFAFTALLFVLLHLFPSMRGPTWDASDVDIGVVLALLAIWLRP